MLVWSVPYFIHLLGGATASRKKTPQLLQVICILARLAQWDLRIPGNRQRIATGEPRVAPGIRQGRVRAGLGIHHQIAIPSGRQETAVARVRVYCFSDGMDVAWQTTGWVVVLTGVLSLYRHKSFLRDGACIAPPPLLTELRSTAWDCGRSDGCILAVGPAAARVPCGRTREIPGRSGRK